MPIEHTNNSPGEIQEQNNTPISTQLQKLQAEITTNNHAKAEVLLDDLASRLTISDHEIPGDKSQVKENQNHPEKNSVYQVGEGETDPLKKLGIISSSSLTTQVNEGSQATTPTSVANVGLRGAVNGTKESLTLIAGGTVRLATDLLRLPYDIYQSYLTKRESSKKDA